MDDKHTEQELDIADERLRDKLIRFSKKAGKKTIVSVLRLYYVAEDPDTPRWALAVIATAIAYFILPIDGILDVLPFGLVDDLAILTAALKKVSEHIKPEHEEKAALRYQRWVSKQEFENDAE